MTLPVHFQPEEPKDGKISAPCGIVLAVWIPRIKAWRSYGRNSSHTQAPVTCERCLERLDKQD